MEADSLFEIGARVEMHARQGAARAPFVAQAYRVTMRGGRVNAARLLVKCDCGFPQAPRVAAELAKLGVYGPLVEQAVGEIFAISLTKTSRLLEEPPRPAQINCRLSPLLADEEQTTLLEDYGLSRRVLVTDRLLYFYQQPRPRLAESPSPQIGHLPRHLFERLRQFLKRQDRILR